jgi:anti-sigma B factor antagonist
MTNPETPPTAEDHDLISVDVSRPTPRLAVVTVSGEVDISTAPVLRDRARAQLDDSHVIVLDLRTVRFFGSAGMAVLLEMREETIDRDIELRLVATSRIVTRPLAVSGIEHAFQFHSTLKDAVA